MKTIITILFFFVCSMTVAQTITPGGYSINRVLNTYIKRQAKVTDMYPAVVSDWMYETLLREIVSLQTQIAALKAGTGSDSITVLRKEIEKLKAETVTIVFKGFKKVDSTGEVQTIEIDPKLLDPPKYSTVERDTLRAAGLLKEGAVFYNTTTAVLQVLNKTGFKNL